MIVKNYDRAFAAAAPSLWNALPNDIRNANTIIQNSPQNTLFPPCFTLCFVSCFFVSFF